MKKFLSSSSAVRPHPFVAARAFLIGAASIGFGLAFVVLAQILNKPLLLFAIPAAMVFFVLVALYPKAFMIGVLYTRALTDSVLTYTRVSFLGIYTGIGGVLNFIVIFFGVCIAYKDVTLWKRIPGKRYWVFYFLWMAFSIVHSPVKGEAIKLWVNLVTYGVVFMAPFYLIREMKDIAYWMKTLVFSSFVPVLLGYADLAQGGRFMSEVGPRVTGTFSHPNILAFYLLLTIVVLFVGLKARFLQLNKTMRGLAWCYLLVVVVLLLATKTRSSWIALWLFFVTYGILKEKKFLVWGIVMPPIALCLPPVLERIKDVFQNTSGSLETGLNSFAWRVELWRQALGYIGGHALWGMGLESFKPFSVQFFPAGQEVGAHNVYLQTFFETGIIGLVAFIALLGMLAMAFYKFMRLRTPFSLVYACGFSLILGYAAICVSDNLLYYLAYNWYFFFFTATLLRFGQIDEEYHRLRHHSVI